MSTVPRIVRAAPRGPISTPEQGIPVNVLIRWYSGETALIPATAVAWTHDAVEIQWEAPELGLRRDWVPAEDVSRPDARGRREDENQPDLRHDLHERREEMPPRNRAGNRKPRW
jgi:hypothetical protein